MRWNKCDDGHDYDHQRDDGDARDGVRGGSDDDEGEED